MSSDTDAQTKTKSTYTSLPIEVERSDVPLDKLPQLSDTEMPEAMAEIETQAAISEAATRRATRERQKLVDAGIAAAVGSTQWGHVKRVARAMGMSRTQLARLIERKHPGFLETVAPERGRKRGYAGARAAEYTGTKAA